MPIKTLLRQVLFGRTQRYIWLCLVFVGYILLNTLFAIPQKTEAATSGTMNFQARLLQSSGAVVPDGYYNIEFKLYNVNSGGSALWTETYYDSNGVTAGNDNRLRVANGYVTVNLGSLTAFSSSMNWDQEHWLTMNVGGTTQTSSPTWDGEMSPRLKLTAVPYAFSAGQLQQTNGGNTSTLKFATQTNARSILLPDESGTLCIQGSTNCGFASASGSSSYIQNGTSLQTGANFNIQSAATGSVGAIIQGANGQTADLLQLKNGTGTPVLTVGSTGSMLVQPSTNSTTAFQIQNAAGTSNLFVADTTNTRIGIGKTAPDYTLDVNGDINTSGTFRINGSAICTSGGCAPSSGSGDYIQNGTTTQAGNFNIQSNASGSIGGIIQGATSQTADLFQLVDSDDTLLFTASASGAVLSQNNADSTTAFQIQNAAGTSNLFVADTTNTRIGIGTASPQAALHVSSTGDSADLFRVTDSTTTATDVFSIANGGGVAIRTTGDNTSAFSVGNGGYTGFPSTLSVDTTLTNYGGNPSFETNTNGWQIFNSGVTLSRTTSHAASGVASLQVATPASANRGAEFPVSMGTYNNYTLSFYAKAASGFSTFAYGWSDGVSHYACASGQTLTTDWKRFSCNFSTDILGGYSIYMSQTDSTARTFYVDAVQLEAGNYTTGLRNGNIQLNGTVSSPVFFQNSSNSDTAFTIQNANGSAKLLVADTVNNTVKLNQAIIQPATNSTSVFQIQNAAGTSNLFIADTTNNRIAIGKSSADYKLDVDGDINITGVFRINGTEVCGASGCSISDPPYSFINNDTVEQDANFNIRSGDGADVGGIIRGAAGQTADLFQLKDASANSVFKVSNDGDVTSQASTNSTTAFQIQNAAGTSNLFIADTTNTRIAIGQATANYTLDVNGDINTTGILRIDGVQIASADLSDTANIAKLDGTGPQTFTGNNTFTGNVLVQRASNSTTAFQIQNAAGTSNLFIADTTNNRIAINKATADYALDVTGDINVTGSFRINGTEICTSGGCTPSGGPSGDFIEDGISTQTANFNIQSGNAANIAAVIQGASGQSVDTLQVKDGSGNVILGVGNTGDTLVKTSTNSTTGFQIQNASNAALVTADTTNMVFKVGTTGSVTLSGAELLVADAEFSGTLRIGDATNNAQFDGTTKKLLLSGTARQSQRVTLVPEFPGAVFTPDGSNNSGTMTTDLCSGSSRLNINASICGSSEEFNYYSWLGSGGTNDYDVYVRWQVPSDFSAFSDSNAIKLHGWRATSSEKVELALFQANGTQCGSTTEVNSSSTTWQQTALTGDETACSISADDVVTFRVKLTASSGGYVRVSNLEINYLTKF